MRLAKRAAIAGDCAGFLSCGGEAVGVAQSQLVGQLNNAQLVWRGYSETWRRA